MPPPGRENRYQQLFEISAEGLLTIDAEGRIDLANRRMCELVQSTSEKVIGRPVLELVDPRDRDAMQEALDQGWRGLEQRLDVRLLQEGGGVRWSGISASPIVERGRVAGSLYLISDITERKRLQSLFENSLDAILLMNDDGGFSDANSSAEVLFGYPRNEIRELRFTAFTPPPTDVEALERWNRFLTSGKQYGEFPVRRKDGSMIDIEYCAVVGIQPGLHLVVARDISARKEAEANLAESKARLEALSERLVRAQEDERGRIARELHDDIGQTLTAVVLGLEASLRMCTCGAAAQQIQTMRHDLESTMRQIRTICLGLRPLVLDDLGLAAALRSYLDSLAQSNGLTVHFSSTLPVGRLCADVEIACFRIVQEALTNVLRHSEATEVRVTLQNQRAWVQVAIRDNGVGFDVDAPLRDAGRSGLGLIGMQERVRLLGGKFGIASSPGEGTQIEVALYCACLAEALR